MSDRGIIFSAPMVLALLDGRKTQTRRVMKPQPMMTKPTIFGTILLGQRRVAYQENAAIGEGYIDLPYAPGDRLWVREAWRPHYLGDGAWDIDVSYPADGARRRIYDGEFGDRDWNWPKAADRGNVTPLHMPRWASRLTLTVTDVRVQRLQEISEADAVAEGCDAYRFPGPWWQGYRKMGDGDLLHQQVVADAPPDWMIEPHRMRDQTHLNRSAVGAFRGLWSGLHGPDAWGANPWVVALTFTVRKGNIDAVLP